MANLAVVAFCFAQKALRKMKGASGATRTISAKDSESKLAHYVCDGISDENEINQAIQDLA